MLIGDQASDQDWVLNVPETKDQGAFDSHFVPLFFFRILDVSVLRERRETTQYEELSWLVVSVPPQFFSLLPLGDQEEISWR